MAKVIWKYPISGYACQFKVPVGAHALHVGLQDDAIMVWMLVDDGPALEPKEVAEFYTIATGEPMLQQEGFLMHYIGTVHPERFVFHVFRKLPLPKGVSVPLGGK